MLFATAIIVVGDPFSPNSVLSNAGMKDGARTKVTCQQGRGYEQNLIPKVDTEVSHVCRIAPIRFSACCNTCVMNPGPYGL